MNRTSRIWPVIGTSLLLTLCALMQGCVGAGLSWSKTESFQASDPKALQKVLSYRGAETNLTAYTPAWLETNWGKPDSTKRNGKSGKAEIWTYGDDLSWNGAMLFVIIPIPLEVPVGREWTKMTIQDGRVVGVRRRVTRAAGGIVGYSIGPCGITGFGTHSLSN